MYGENTGVLKLPNPLGGFSNVLRAMKGLPTSIQNLALWVYLIIELAFIGALIVIVWIIK